MQNVQTRQIYRQKVNWQLLRAGVEGAARGGVAKGYGVSLCGDRNLPKLTVVMGALSVNILLKATTLYTLNRCIIR